jgi:two-component system sensor histidine kinase KdpD
MAHAEQEQRPDPEALLAALHREGRGRLKIFLGAAPGVGKTWEMLAAARRLHAEGRGVLIGIVETHGRAETESQIGVLPVLPRRMIPYRGQTLDEFDLDAALAARPALILIDELAHTNAPGSRHPKRWQDVQELIEAGIDVWATLNVQHLESLNDPVARITGVRVAETLPDSVLDLADEIELIDLPPAELRARLTEGRIYRRDVAQRALDGFFREGNLAALREMALRRAATRVDRDVTSYMRARAIAGPWPAGERVLALIGPDAGSTSVVRHAARLAEGLRAPWIALYVEQPNDPPGAQAALDLAVEVGGEVETRASNDLLDSVLDVARRRNVTQIVLGRARSPLWRRVLGRTLTQSLLRRGSAFSLHVAPAPLATPVRRARWRLDALPWLAYALTLVLIAAITVGGVRLRPLLPAEAMGMIFVAAVVSAGSFYGRGIALFAAMLGFLSWNFFFLNPVFNVTIADPRDVVALLVFLLVATLTGGLAGRVRAEARAAQARVDALRRLSLFSRRLGKPTTREELVREITGEAAEMATAAMLMLGEEGVLQPVAAEPEGTEIDEAARAAAQWAFQNAVSTGIGTTTLPSVPWRWLVLHNDQGPIGVLGVRPEGPPSAPLVQTLSALADQASLALERIRLAQRAAETAAQTTSQRLLTALLSSLSHDLRTPLTAIRGAAETLRSAGEALDAPTRADLLAAITQDTARMTRFLANITEMARIETGEVAPRSEVVDLHEVIEAAVARVAGAVQTGVNLAPDAARVRGDPTLIEQVLVNLLDNAVKYAPAGSMISIAANRLSRAAGAMVEIDVKDEGVGIQPEDLPHVFNRFYRAQHGDRVPAGTGLGLAIARAFTEAMGGQISAQSPRPDAPADGAPGSLIRLQLPAA